MNLYKFIGLIIILFNQLGAYSQNSNLQNLITSKQWDSLFPKRAGTFGTHPQGYTTDFYSFNNLNQAVDDMADYFVKIRTKKGVWGQLITITKKTNMFSYNYAAVDTWWYSNTTPETIVTVDFKDFINDSSQLNNKRELAAFLANISKETTGGWQLPVGGGSNGDYASWGLYFVHEVGYNSSNSVGTYSQSHSEYPPNNKVGYYGRGPIQLSWNYNYGQLSKFLFNDKTILLNNPDTLQKNGILAFKSAIWFWMMPQCPKPSCHQVMHDLWLPDSADYTSAKMYKKGFAHTNNIINGGLECRTASSNAFTQKVILRSNLYKFYLKKMGLNSSLIPKEDTGSYTTLCYDSASKTMQDYVNCKVINSYTGFVSIDNQSACDSYTWRNGKTYTKNNKTAIHKVKGVAKNGLDSILFLNLNIKNKTIGIDKQIACNSYTWIDGKTYTSSNNTATYKLIGGANNSCDSIVQLNLTILNNANAIDTQVACNSFTWIDGKTYTSSNNTATYKLIGGANNGCDSVIQLNLTILNNSYAIDTQVACNSFTWVDGKTYTSRNDTATYKLIGGANNGCDSTIKLNLTILNSSYAIDKQIACNSFTWIDGKTYTSSNNTATYKFIGGANNGCDSIVTLNLTVLNNSHAIDTQVACNSYTWIDGKTYTSNNNTATYKLIGGANNGCDSIVTLNLTINSIDVSVIENNLILTAKSPVGNYQWIDCNKGPINGETKQTFNVTKSGNYAVIISFNGCIDTSICYLISILEINELENKTKFIIYPNPSHNKFTIFSNNIKPIEFFITDIKGKTIQTGTLNYGNNQILIENHPKGIYLINISGEMFKLIKQ